MKTILVCITVCYAFLCCKSSDNPNIIKDSSAVLTDTIESVGNPILISFEAHRQEWNEAERRANKNKHLREFAFEDSVYENAHLIVTLEGATEPGSFCGNVGTSSDTLILYYWRDFSKPSTTSIEKYSFVYEIMTTKKNYVIKAVKRSYKATR